MAMTELILGATRATQLLLSVIFIGLSSGAVHSLTRGNIGGHSLNYYCLFVSLFNLLSLIFLVTSQFLFVHQYDGYNTYITVGVACELLNWLFLFAAWVSTAQFGNSPNCHAALAFHKSFVKTCTLDRVLLGFMVLLWCAWSISLAIMVRLKLNEEQERKSTKEIELRIKSAVESQARDGNSSSTTSQHSAVAGDGRGNGVAVSHDMDDVHAREKHASS